MLREKLIVHQWQSQTDFRWRGGSTSRLEGFSDAVFGFSLTLLVVSSEVPKTAEQLFQIIQGFPAFAVTFATLFGIWYVHYIFFRRYGLYDGVTTVLNALLLFVVVFYIYPLKFLSTWLINVLLLRWMLNIDIYADVEISGLEMGTVMLVYSAGFLLVFLIFSLLYLHAYRKRDILQLDELEQYDTVSAVRAYFICVVFAVISILMVWLGGDDWASMAGVIYMFIGPVEGINGYIRGRGYRALKAKMTSQDISVDQE